jgi:endonuclease/exonuclease/phosphatase family metal-dependent hydrolase
LLLAALGALSMVPWLAACPTPQSPDGGAGEGEGEGEGESPPDSCTPDENTGFPAPRSDVTDAIGSRSTFDVATWNIRNFPETSTTTATVADVITSLDLDLVALQEIADQRAFDELLARLPAHEGLLSTHAYSDGSYQKTAVLYRCGALSPGLPASIFTGDGGAFPRPPLQIPFHYDDGDRVFDFTVIVVHFKADESADSSARRAEAFTKLANYVDSYVASAAADEVIILGDFNERLDEAPGSTNWRPFLDTSKYVVRTKPLADDGEASFLSSSNALIDHIVTTRALDDEVSAGVAVVPRVEFDVPNYRNAVSDHRPVVLVMRGL